MQGLNNFGNSFWSHLFFSAVFILISPLFFVVLILVSLSFLSFSFWSHLSFLSFSFWSHLSFSRSHSDLTSLSAVLILISPLFCFLFEKTCWGHSSPFLRNIIFMFWLDLETRRVRFFFYLHRDYLPQPSLLTQWLMLYPTTSILTFH